jgi:pimeloyl-ACP methyl ester carboxylesterase
MVYYDWSMSAISSPNVIEKLSVLGTPMPWHKAERIEGNEELVICMHGLWRSYRAMGQIVRSVADAGYSTLNVPYPSFRESLDEMVERVDDLVTEERKRYRKIHFVTHSLGGVIVRNYLNTHAHSECERVVMVAPPLHGSKIVDWMQRSSLHKVLGPAGTFLSTEEMAQEKEELPEDVEVAVIMGNRIRIPMLHRIIDEECDGVVRVASGKAAGVKEFKVIPADHTMITVHEEVLDAVPRFLSTGRLSA